LRIVQRWLLCCSFPTKWKPNEVGRMKWKRRTCGRSMDGKESTPATTSWATDTRIILSNNVEDNLPDGVGRQHFTFAPKCHYTKAE
jgi:hypothetical protein